jgi:phospholipase C
VVCGVESLLRAGRGPAPEKGSYPAVCSAGKGESMGRHPAWRSAQAAAAAGCLASFLAACAAGPSGAPALQPGARDEVAGFQTRASGKIAHVVFIMQENRSFDDLFQGYPGANTVSQGLDSHGNVIALQPISMKVPYDIYHGFAAFREANDGGKQDGFDLEKTAGNTFGYSHPQYGYVPHVESQLYFRIAGRYVLGDAMFASHLDASFVSHQYMIAGQAASSVNLPSTAWGCPGGKSDLVQTLTLRRKYGPHQQACFDYQTLADELDAAGLDWRYYAAQADYIWSGYQAVKHIRYGSDWSKIEAPSNLIISDVKGGYLPAVTWVTPALVDSDHSSSGSADGPQWVASVINAIGESPYWDSTAIFVMWDEWGGWYDHVAPVQLDYDGLGFRVPLLVVSPYAKRGYVSHVQYETGSILRFIEDQFGLGRLAASDRRATSPAKDCFDFKRAPRPFVPFKFKKSAEALGSQPADFEPTDAD